MTDIEIGRGILTVIEQSERRLAVIVAEHREGGEIYAKAYGDGDLASKFRLTIDQDKLPHMANESGLKLNECI